MALTLPVAAVNTTNVDSGADRPDLARPDIFDAINKLNSLLANLSTGTGAGTLAVRDGSGKLAGDVLGSSASCTGNAATATTAAGLSAALDWDKQPSFRGCLVYGNSATSTPSKIAFPSEVYDTDNIHSTSSNTTRLTVPTGVTRVVIKAFVECNSTAASSQQFTVCKNGTAGLPGLPSFNFQSSQVELSLGKSTIASAVLSVTAGDYFEIEATNGVTTTNCWFAMEIVR